MFLEKFDLYNSASDLTVLRAITALYFSCDSNKQEPCYRRENRTMPL